MEQLINNLKNIREAEFNDLKYIPDVDELETLKSSKKDSVTYPGIQKNKINLSTISTKRKKQASSNELLIYGVNDIVSEIKTIDLNDMNIYNKEAFEISTTKLIFNDLSIKDKLLLINNYLKTKNIMLDVDEKNKIIEKINDSSFDFKSYITISKVYRTITKMTFLKRQEGNIYYVDFTKK